MREAQASPEQVPCPLRATALAKPDATAILSARQAVSYAKLDRMVSFTTMRLLEAGFEPGARVALYLPQDVRYIVLLLALLRAGCVSCPLSTRLPPEGVYRLLDKAGCSELICEDEELLEVSSRRVRGIRPEALLGLENGGTSPTYLPLGQPATVVFTSGSTVGPKAALHTFGNHYYSALGSNANIALSPDDRWLLLLPLYHVGGLSILFRCLLAGAANALPEPGASLDRSIDELGVTHVSLVATQLRCLLEEKTEIGNLKAVLLGGGPTPESLLKEAVVRCVPVYSSYGLTEMTSQVTTTSPNPDSQNLRTSGRILKHREITLSEEGEILVRGETLFAGYVEGGVLDRPLDAEGWFHTGDLGDFDDRGSLYVRGRMDNLFISGGENIQPEEIEAALERTAGVQRAIVAPVPDVEFGERPVAFIQMTGEKTQPEKLGEKLESILPRFKVPVAFYGWPEDADTEGMKPDRALFRERALALYGA